MHTLNKQDINILFTEYEVKHEIMMLASRINDLFRSIPREEIVVIGVLSGAFKFISELINYFDFDFQLKWINCKSYEDNNQGDNIEIDFVNFVPNDLSNKYVILIDDILDTGQTISKILEKLQNKNYAKYIYKVFLVKRLAGMLYRLCDDYCFEINNNEYLVGFGLDDNEYKRNLPFIGVKNAVYSENE